MFTFQQKNLLHHLICVAKVTNIWVGRVLYRRPHDFQEALQLLLKLAAYVPNKTMQMVSPLNPFHT
jgi:hypothetical protein